MNGELGSGPDSSDCPYSAEAVKKLVGSPQTPLEDAHVGHLVRIVTERIGPHAEKMKHLVANVPLKIQQV